MPRRSRGLMSDALKYDLARELGVADVVSTEGWGGVSSKNCGNLVKLAVARAQAAMAAQYGRSRPETQAPGAFPEAYRVSPGPVTYGGGPQYKGPFPYWAVQTGPALGERRI